MASQEGGAKKLKELRVVDLRRELENRGLDKGGVKAVLTERLQKALEDEGEDPNEYVFEPGTDSPKRPVTTAVTKKTTPRTGAKGKLKEDGDDEEMAEDSLLEEDLDLDDEIGNIDDADMELLESEMQVIDQELGTPETGTNDEEMVEEQKPAETKEDEKPSEPTATVKAPEKTAPAKTEEETPMDTEEEAAVSVPAVKEVKPVAPVKEVKPVTPVKEAKPVTPVKEAKPAPQVKDVKPVPAVKEVKPKGEPVKASVLEAAPVTEKTQVTNTSVKKEDIDAPPDPASVVPLVPLTIEDKIKMDTSQGLQTEENESLDVHVDDTQNDLDADLLGSEKSEKKESAPTEAKVEEKKEEEKEEATPEIKDGETKVESATPDTTTVKETPAVTTPGKDTKGEKKAADKKEENDTSKSASSSTPAKSSTASKDPKKDEKGSSGAGRNLWVSGLSSSTRATDLKALFSKHGKVVGAKVVTNARSPGSKCYGFVTMSTADEATKCIQHLHRTELHGKMISVERAKNEPGAQVKGATAPGNTTRKPDARSPADKKSTSTTPRKDDRDKKDGDKKSDDKKDGDKKDVRRDSRRDSKPSSRSDDKRPHSSSRHDSNRRSTGSDKPRTVVMDKSKGEPVVRVRSRDRSSGRVSKSPSKAKSTTSTTDQKSPAAAAAATKPAAAKEGDTPKKDDSKDTLSFDKIQEERERERLRQKERKLREEERVKKQEIEFEKRRQRDVHMKQRAEAIRLARERERLRKERETLERERLETQRLERLRAEQMERERLEREREEKRRLEQLRLAEAEQRRAALKRTYESRGTRDNEWSQPKRANRFNDNDTRDKGRDNRQNRDANRFNDRNSGSGASGGGNFERKVERYDRREVNRVQENRGNDNRASGRQFEENRRSGGRGEDNFREEQRDERRTDDRFARSYDRNVNHGQAHDTANRSHDRNNMREDRRDTGFNRNQTRDHVRDDRRGMDMAQDDRRGGNVRDNQRDNRNMGVVGGGHNIRGTSPRHNDNRGDWKADRGEAVFEDTRQQADSRVVVRGQTNMASGGRDSWQGGHGGAHGGAHGNYSNVVQDDRNRGGNKSFSGHNSGAGLLGNAPQSQNRQWGSGTDNRGKMESTWTSHNAHSNMEQRVATQQQDRWSGGVTMQQEARPTSFTQPVATGLISVPPNVYMTSVPQQSGMIIGNIATGRQPEPRFDAYKMQTGAIRRTY
ncbi:scaffold attachment factor B2-like isoform X4 [Mizuhopecten yessoensis]|uniref:scaffold attachment factor B2-like isoform X4 n=1 Tax=Mizuhopecten yessoensis TaxID=6573 RepID=UPI000B45A381|nr:scaffold attachment factor B2-like isoform X4 [Mizuhopecten yessoensis]